MIDTRVPGRPSDVRAAAAWLRALRSATATSQDLVHRARRTAGHDWDGSAADAYSGVTRRVLEAGDRHELRLARAASLVEEHAERLAALQARMADVRARASAGGLAVRGTIVEPPREPDGLVLWAGLAEEVARLRAEHDVWIRDRLVREAEEDEDPRLGMVLDALGDRAAPFLTAAGTVLGTRRLGRMAEQMAERSADAQRRADARRKDARSGHPARRAAASGVGAREERRGLERVAAEAADLADDARSAARVLGPVGTAIDVVVAADKIRDGASPSETIVSSAAGMGGAAAAAVVVGGTFGAPVVVTALAAGAGAVGASELVAAGWRRLPDEVTDAVDDAVADGWEGATGALADGWDAVSGWGR